MRQTEAFEYRSQVRQAHRTPMRKRHSLAASLPATPDRRKNTCEGRHGLVRRKDQELQLSWQRFQLTELRLVVNLGCV
jgi:hypothetical protein